MQRRLLPFVGVLVGLYLGLGLLLRSVAPPPRHAPEPELLSETVLKMYTPPLLSAVTQGDRDEATRLLQTGTDPNGADHVGRTPLLAAAREGDLQMVRELIAAGARIDAQDKIGGTPLLYAVRNGRSLPIVLLLLEHGADASHVDRFGESPLLMTCDSADTTAMEALLKRGAPVDRPDRIGMTPLMRVARGLAVERARKNSLQEPGAMRRSAMELLLNQGADVRIRDHRGWTALLYAGENEQPEAIRLLLQHGADPRITVKGRTPLRNAASFGLLGNLKVLLASDANYSPDERSDALMQATFTGRDDAVLLLLDNGADVDFCDQYGATPLMLAIANDHLSTAKLLLQRGANSRLRDLQGRSALEYAPVERRAAIRKELFGSRRFPHMY